MAGRGFSTALVTSAASVTYILCSQSIAAASTPIALTVPFVASNPLNPHTSWSGNPVTLKGSLKTDSPGNSFSFDWDPGDGGAHCTGPVADIYSIGCAHTYTGAVGTLFVAKLTVTDTTAGLTSAAANYYTSLNAPPPNLPVEVNNAIDNGLWYVHTRMRRSTDGNGVNQGDWYTCNGNKVDGCFAGSQSGSTGANCNAFEVSGFLRTNIPANPYSDDVDRCLNTLATQYTIPTGISPTVTNDFGTTNTDQNGNTVGVLVTDGNDLYQGGMVMDAIIASGTPGQVVPLGNLTGTGGGTGPAGAYTYKDLIYDMTDYYAFCQHPGGLDWLGNTVTGGGWRYSCQEAGDNSVAQWAAIGIIPSRRNFAAPIDTKILSENVLWLQTSFQNNGTSGLFGYDGPSPIWGPFADTPSGMVQLSMNGHGRGSTLPNGTPAWDLAETFIRDNFGNPENCCGDAFSNAANSLMGYPYGMLSFTKSMLLHSNDGAGLTATPLNTLISLDDPSKPPIDWYAAQTPAYGGTDASNGIARTLVARQDSDGAWFGRGTTGAHYYFETAWSITMLNKTVFQPVPVACAIATPNHVASGGPVLLDGSCSVEQNPAFSLVTWKWQIDGLADGSAFQIAPGSPKCLVASCVKVVANFTLPTGKSLPYSYPVRLRVTDNANPALSADVVFNVIISSPPNPPSANAGGPYNFCSNQLANGTYIYQPWILDGSKSTNPDQGQTDGTPGAPPSTITGYQWDFNCAGTFTDASGPQPNVTGAFLSKIGQNFNVCLRVTNNDVCTSAIGSPPACAFPTAGVQAAPLSSVAFGSVFVRPATDANCTHCVSNLTGLGKASAPGSPGNAQLSWNDTNSAAFPFDHYNIIRSTDVNFTSFVQIAGASSIYGIAAVPVPAVLGAKIVFIDTHVNNSTTYYYRVAPATANDTETCGSNVTLKVVIGAGR